MFEGKAINWPMPLLEEQFYLQIPMYGYVKELSNDLDDLFRFDLIQ